MNHPFAILLTIVAGLTLGKMWRDDLQAMKRGAPNPRGLPGATPVSGAAIWLAVAGALVLLAIETGGELALGVAGEQSKMTGLFALYSVLAAPLVEETIFRGFLVIEGRGRAALWGGIVAASAGFAGLHPFLWRWDDAGFVWTIGLKGAFSTTTVFAFSLWLYAVRFWKWNPGRSLLPCFAAHAAKNLGVVAIKGATGFLGGWW